MTGAGHPARHLTKGHDMNLTSSRLTATAGLCAATAGAIYIAVQIKHPPADVANVLTTEMTVREIAKAGMTVLALAGFTGMFIRNRRRFGVVGLAGYLLLSVGFLGMFAVQCIVAAVLPTVAKSNPGYVQDFLDAAMGGSPHGDIGHMQTLFTVTGMGYAIGGLLFGIALFRAGVLSRWASLLLAYATTSVLALSVLPESFSRPFAVPAGVAMIGLGVSLWRDQRRPVELVESPAAVPFAELATR
jgi:hypothetical protein